MRTYPTLRISALNASSGIGSVNTMRTMTMFPVPLIHRFKETNGKSDQMMLTAAYRNSRKTHELVRRTLPQSILLLNKTTTPIRIRARKMFRSSGLPSMARSVISTESGSSNHAEIFLEPMIINQVTGIQMARDIPGSRGLAFGMEKPLG